MVQHLDVQVLNTTGLTQTLTTITDATVTFDATVGKNFLVLNSTSGTCTAVADAKTPCDMPLAHPADSGLHDFTMSVDNGETKTFYIPYQSHYIDGTTGLITMTCTITNLKIGVFKMP